MAITRQSLTLLGLLVMQGCHEGGPTEFIDVRALGASHVITPITPARFSVLPGDVIVPPPAVSLVSRDGKPVVNWRVTFTLEEPSGEKARFLTTTDENGIARLNGWTVGAGTGQHRMIASADSAVRDRLFIAFVPGTIIATYDLVSVAGAPPAAGVESQYVLYDDGSYFARPFGRQSVTPSGRYKTIDATTIAFYLEPDDWTLPVLAQKNFLYSTGRLNGREMTVVIPGVTGDLEPYPIEKYLERK